MRKKIAITFVLTALTAGALTGCGNKEENTKTTTPVTTTEAVEETKNETTEAAKETEYETTEAVKETEHETTEAVKETEQEITEALKETEYETAVTEETETEATEAAAAVRSITDHAGTTVVVPEQINRIVVTDTLPLPSVLSVYLGEADSIVGMSPASMKAANGTLLGELYPEILEADTSFFAGNELNMESLLNLQPDVVFYNAGSTAIEEALLAAGIPAVAVSVTGFGFDAAKTYEEWLRLLEEVFPQKAGTADRYVSACEAVQEEIQTALETVEDQEKKDVFFLFNYNDAGIITSGEKFWGQYWCDVTGTVNVSKEVPAEKSNAVVNMEQVYEWDPEYIFISNFTDTQPSDLYENTKEGYDWSPVKAVEQKQVYKMPFGTYRTFTPNTDTPMTMLWMASVLYPELFESVDMTERTIEYYKDVYDVTLTNEQASAIFGDVKGE